VPSLVTTLRQLLAQADALFEAGRIGQARTCYEDVLQRAQEKADRASEVVARSMLARIHLKRRDMDAAREELQLAAQFLDPLHLESHGRYRMVLARLAVAESPDDVGEQELLAYLHWAEEQGAHEQVIDACLLLAVRGDRDEQVRWLRRAIDYGLDHRVERRIGEAYMQLGALLDEATRYDDALEAYQQALHWHRRRGAPRQMVAAAWAVGAVACRLEDYPLARTRLDEAVEAAEQADETCGDLLALALADLAVVYEAAGDVVEARRLLLRSSVLAREQDLPRFWPDRWRDMVAHAKRLELEL